MENIISSNPNKKNYLINKRNIFYPAIVTLRFNRETFLADKEQYF